MGRVGQRHLCVLLHQQNRGAPSANLADDVADLLHHHRRQPK
jgi:hypothetical protein